MLKDLTGLIFGRLTVQSLIGVVERRSVWLCVCQCGKTCEVKGSQLSGWSLSELDCVDLFKGDCYYCGDKPSTIAKSGTNQPTVFTFNGIDRINNNLGYIKENVISCCQICNRAKRSMTFDDFMCWVDKISNNYWKNFYAR